MADVIDDGTNHVTGVRVLNFVGPGVSVLGQDAVQVWFPLLYGTAAPNVGNGVPHQMPCLYIRNNANSTELWVANGVLPTNWQQVTIP